MKRVKSLLIPYAIFSFVTWCIWAAFALLRSANVDSYLMPLFQTFIAQGSAGFLVHNVPLWFVTCLFGIEIIYYFISVLSSKYILLITCCLAIISDVLIRYCSILDFSLMPWNLEVVCLGLPIYAIGNLIFQKISVQSMQVRVSNNRLIAFATASLLAIILYFTCQINGHISFGHSSLGNYTLLAYFNGFIGIAMMLLFSMLLANYSNKIMSGLIWFGRNSFDAMVIHNPIKGFICIVVGYILHCSSMDVSLSDSYSFIAFIITLVLTIIGILFIKWAKKNLVQKINKILLNV